MLVPLSSTYSISPRIDNNNFHLGFLRKTKEKEDEREREERDGFEERERPGRVWVPSALGERERETVTVRLTNFLLKLYVSLFF